jgi:Flp pilus assembly protein TadD
MSGILRNRVADPVRIEKDCARARSQVPKVQDKIAAAIANILALWNAGDFDAALLSAQQARKANRKSGDISCILGVCYLKVSPSKPEEADKAFREAYGLGCGRPELAPNWLEAKRLYRDWNGIVDLATRFRPPILGADRR